MESGGLSANVTTLDPKDDLEERLMAMLYRRYLEFAVGHGVSVHADVAEDSPDRAVRIKTVVVPSYEVPRTTPPSEEDSDENPAFGKLAGLILDMKILADSNSKTLPKQLEPLVTAYRDWIDGEESKLNDPKQGFCSNLAMRAGSPSTIAGLRSRELKKGWNYWRRTRRLLSHSSS